MSRKFPSQKGGDKKQIIRNMIDCSLNYIDERLENSILLLTVLSRPGFVKLIRESFNDITHLKKEMRRELEIITREAINLTHGENRYEPRANARAAFKNKRSL